MTEQNRHLVNKYEDNVNLQGAEAYRGGRPLTACYRLSVHFRSTVTYNHYNEDNHTEIINTAVIGEMHQK